MNGIQRTLLQALLSNMLQDESHPDPVARLYSCKMRIEAAIGRYMAEIRQTETVAKQSMQSTGDCSC